MVLAGRRRRYWVIYIVDRRIKFLFWPRTISFATIYYIILFHYSNRSTRAATEEKINKLWREIPRQLLGGNSMRSRDRTKLDHILITFDDRSP